MSVSHPRAPRLPFSVCCNLVAEMAGPPSQEKTHIPRKAKGKFFAALGRPVQSPLCRARLKDAQLWRWLLASLPGYS